MAEPFDVETPAEQQSRLETEQKLIEEARSDIAAGRFVEGAELDVWLDALEADMPLDVKDGSHRSVTRR